MASSAKSCCGSYKPAQHPPIRGGMVPGSQQHTERNDRKASTGRCGRSMRCSAAYTYEGSIRHGIEPSWSTLSPTSQEALCRPCQGSYIVDVVLITRACPYTVAELAKLGEAEDSNPLCRFPDADVYMSRDTFNHFCESVEQSECPDVREKAKQALDLVCFRLLCEQQPIKA
jgi:hypothetical protein